MKPYVKTQEDQNREASDLKTNAVMRWLLNQDAFKFNPGDVLIKKQKRYGYNPQTHSQTFDWEIEVITKATGAPKKYVYCFENQLGIGYVRQLKAKGDGYSGTLICVANFDPENTRFELDPDFIDHQIIGEGEFQYNQEYAHKRKYRDEAMAANRAIMIKTSNKAGLKDWWLGLKIGDEFWSADSFDDLEKCKYKVSQVQKCNKPNFPPRNDYYGGGNHKKDYANRAFLEDKEWVQIEVTVLKSPYERTGSTKNYTIGDFSWKKVTMVEPFPMKDPLCAPLK